MRQEPKIGAIDIEIGASNEPYITEDFSAIDVTDPCEPVLGVSFKPIPQRGDDPTEVVKKSDAPTL